jgi:biopolymer transport protein ExbB/TolQ
MACLSIQEAAPWVVSPWQRPIVFYILSFFSIIMLIIIGWKWAQLRLAKNTSIEYAPKVSDALKKREWGKAMEITLTYKKTSHLAQLLLVGLEERERSEGEKLSKPQIAINVGRKMEREAIILHGKYQAGTGFVDAIGNTAPFIGALGGSPETLAFGTALAIPTIWFATHFRNKTQRLEREMKTVASEIVEYFENSGSGNRVSSDFPGASSILPGL